MRRLLAGRNVLEQAGEAFAVQLHHKVTDTYGLP